MPPRAVQLDLLDGKQSNGRLERRRQHRLFVSTAAGLLQEQQHIKGFVFLAMLFDGACGLVRREMIDSRLAENDTAPWLQHSVQFRECDIQCRDMMQYVHAHDAVKRLSREWQVLRDGPGDGNGSVDTRPVTITPVSVVIQRNEVGIDRDNVVAQSSEHLRGKPRAGTEVEDAIPWPAIEQEQNGAEIEQPAQALVMCGDAKRELSRCEYVWRCRCRCRSAGAGQDLAEKARQHRR
ncbi:MAG TPA: hypothetical protein VMO26_07800 [Vicinamibacterales bacterium]|nr:hypothetical protein [Vicinamibacterales bacterium]